VVEVSRPTQRKIVFVGIGLGLVVAGAMALYLAPPSDACKVRVDELATWMREAAAEGDATDLPVPPSVHLVRLDDVAGPLPADPFIVLDGRAVGYSGVPTGDVDHPAELAKGLTERLADQRTLHDVLYPGRPAPAPGAVIEIDAAAPWSAVATLAGALAAAHVERVGFAFDARTKVAIPKGAAAAAAAIARAPVLTPEELKSKIASATEPMAEACPPLVAAFGSLADAPATPAQKVARLAERVPPAVLACDCAVDMDAVKTAYWQMLGRTTGSPHRVVSVLLAGESSDAKEVVFAGAEPWSAAHRAILGAELAGARIRLVAR
jgi:hypothetical protein